MSIAKISSILKKSVLKRLKTQGFCATDIEGFYMNRLDEPKSAEKCFYNPKIILMVQGCKRAVVGSETNIYRENQCLISGVDIPGTSYVAQASPQNPLITLSLNLNLNDISEMLSQMPQEKINGNGLCKGLAVFDADEGLMSAFLRLVELLDNKDEMALLAPLVVREIYFRILLSPMGRHVREFCTLGTQGNQISRAVKWLKMNFTKNFRIDELAKYVNMAPTTFHRHFREITFVSPIQYQKNLRLHEAKRLMIAESKSVSEAAYNVGYESTTQFSREYKRHFGISPKQDVSA